MPRVLSDTDVADFRDRLCEAAERLLVGMVAGELKPSPDPRG